MRQHWRILTLAVCYLAAGVLILAAALRLITEEPAHSAVLYGGIGLLLAFAGRRFLTTDNQNNATRSLLLVVLYAGGGGLLLTGLALVTPAGPPRQFIGFAGAGALLGLLGWRFLSERAVGSPLTPSKETPQQRDTRWTRDLMMTFALAGITGLLLYSVRTLVPAGKVHDFFQVLGGGSILACGSLLAGGLLGFLFGIPRALLPGQGEPAANNAPEAAGAGDAGRRTPTAFQVNTNLEQISDWLTKIIVGLGLINLDKFPQYFRNLGAYFGMIFGDLPVRDSVALALILLFSICGFLLGYLLTRLFLAGAFRRAETPEETLERLVNEAGKAPPRIGGDEDGRSETVGLSDLAAAHRVAQVATGVDQTELQRQVMSLANEYDTLRDRMPYSAERTRQMESVVSRLRAIALASYGMVDDLTRSSSAGERLAAVVFLQMKPSAKYLVWLAGRFSTERPFVMHHAAVALRRAAESLAPADLDNLRGALVQSQHDLPQKETSTRRVLDEAIDIAEKRKAGRTD